MHNIPFVIVPSPDYMLVIGKNMERDYNVPIHDIEEVEPNENPTYLNNNNEIKEIIEIKSKALELDPETVEIPNEIPQLPQVELTDLCR